jgi:hypothetical protein
MDLSKMRGLMAMTLAAIVMCLVPLALNAQWSSDPLQNLGVGTVTGEQVLPKIAATPDGGCYISWFDSRSGSYSMYLQRLDALGLPLLTPNGLLISSNAQSTSLVDYDLKSDPEGNAILTFTDTRNGGSNDLDVFVYKISPTGVFLWGADGIGLSAAGNTDFEANPKVVATPMGNVVVAWLKSGASNVITFQRLTGLGAKMWGLNGITLSGTTGHSLTSPDLVAADLDNVVALWKDNSGVPWAPTTWLYTQKLDPTGGPLWTTPGVLIYNLGHMSAWTYPKILSDANGGAFFGWYDSPSLSDFTVSVGHVNSAGTLVFPLNGILASTNAIDRLHMYPSITYQPAGNYLYTFWVETNFNQSQYGVYGQKFSPTGARLWTDSGQEFVPLGSNQISFVNSRAAGAEMHVGYFEAPNVTSHAVKAFKTNFSGSLLWGPVLVSSATLGNKDDLEMAVSPDNRAFYTWGDGRNDFSDIYAQNVNANGTLGNQTIPMVSITMGAVNPPIVIPASGGSFNFNITVNNGETLAQTFDAWIMVQLPNLSWYGPVLGPVPLTLPGGASVTRLRSQTVPGSAPMGSYWYEGRVGDYPSVVWDTSGFAFTKLGTGIQDSDFSGWVCTGDAFPGEQPLAAFIPSGLDLKVNPNPFNPSTAISYQLQAASRVSLKVYDTAGRLVATLVEGWREAGTHEATFDGSGLASGFYLAKLEAVELSGSGATPTIRVQKLVLLK